MGSLEDCRPDRLAHFRVRNEARQGRDMLQSSRSTEHMSQAFRIAVGADHGGVRAESSSIADHLRRRGHACGTAGPTGRTPSTTRRSRRRSRGSSPGRVPTSASMVDGAGIGSAMAANKVPGVLAAACYNEALARNAREHNDANVLTLGAGQIDRRRRPRHRRRLPVGACTADRHQRARADDSGHGRGAHEHAFTGWARSVRRGRQPHRRARAAAAAGARAAPRRRPGADAARAGGAA